MEGDSFFRCLVHFVASQRYTSTIMVEFNMVHFSIGSPFGK